MDPTNCLVCDNSTPGLNYTRPNSSSDCHPPCLAYQYGNKKKKKKKKKKGNPGACNNCSVGCANCTNFGLDTTNCSVCDNSTPGLNYTRPNSSSDCHPPCLAYQYGNKKKKKKKKVTQEHAITVRLDARTAQISDWTPQTAQFATTRPPVSTTPDLTLALIATLPVSLINMVTKKKKKKKKGNPGACNNCSVGCANCTNFGLDPTNCSVCDNSTPGLNYTRPNSSSDCHPPCLAYQYGNKKKKKKKKVTQEHAITVRLDARTAQGLAGVPTVPVVLLTTLEPTVAKIAPKSAPTDSSELN